MPGTLKERTVNSLKWNVIDKVTAQILYAVTGIVLARELTQEAFGLAGAVLVFQAFANLLVDSGFSYALLQKKSPTRLDCSTVLWFNLIMGAILYGALFVSAPAIARWFGNTDALVPLVRVMCLSVLLNASSIVQSNIFVKNMNVRPVTVANTAAGVVGGLVAIAMALTGFGVWAIVAQTLLLSGVRSAVLWATSGWRPRFSFSWESLRRFFPLGASMMLTSFLNTVFQNIYAFFIGNRANMVSLGYYTQSDKWSKMGVTAVSQTLTSALIPALSSVQDDMERFRRVARRTTRLAAYVVFPFILWLIAESGPLFHLLFGTKWDPSVILFQLLLCRGIFTILTGICGNFLIALGHGRDLVVQESVRDAVALAVLVVTLPYLAIQTPGDPVYGISLLLAGQVGASAISWIYTLIMASRRTGLGLGAHLRDLAPYFVLAALGAAVIWSMRYLPGSEFLLTGAGLIAAGVVYFVGCKVLGSKIQREALDYALKKMGLR